MGAQLVKIEVSKINDYAAMIRADVGQLSRAARQNLNEDAERYADDLRSHVETYINLVLGK